MRLSRWLSRVLPLAAVIMATACDGSSPTLAPTGLSRSSASTTTAPPMDLGGEIRRLIASGFRREASRQVNASWDRVLDALNEDARDIDQDRRDGKRRSGESEAAKRLQKTVALVQRIANGAAPRHDDEGDDDAEHGPHTRLPAVTPPAGETIDHFVARLVLDMSLYVYGGPASVPPPLSPTSDVAFKLVQPARTDTVATPALKAAVIFPAGAVVQPTIVVVTPVETPFPDNCSGPLDTHLCQYPKFYTFNVFPDVKLATPANVQVCHVDSGSRRLPLADHDRFRIAHAKPASATDYTPGSTIVDNVEVLPPVSMTVTDCRAHGGTTYGALPMPAGRLSPLQRVAYLARSAAHRAVFEASRALTVREAYAIDAGGGGSALTFSPFAVVDPRSQADLAQSPLEGSRFSLAAVSGAPGATLVVPAWSVTNRGSGTSGSFTSTLVVAKDTALASAVSTVALAGAASLVPGASFAYPATSVTLPPTAGTYFVGTRIVPGGADSTSGDDAVSIRVTVVPPVGYGADIGIVGPFSIAQHSIVQGNTDRVNGFTISNVGGQPVQSYQAFLLLATDSVLTQVRAARVLDVGGTLAPGASRTVGPSLFPITHCQAPGAYFLGVRVTADSASGDTNLSNDRVSQPVTVLAEALPAGQQPGSAPWTGAGDGHVTTQVNPLCANLDYDDTPSGGDYKSHTFIYTSTAVASGPYTFQWTYSGLHSWFAATAQLEAFSLDGNGYETVVQLIPTTTVHGDFSFSGNATLPLTAGASWGIRATGYHYDYSQILRGHIGITPGTP